ncbi:RpiR family transcriptional regulator [Rhodococcus sp. SC4]|uniref:RpiR family transcriptional regulator n=1 Tax=Rhodococcus opacus TaxID=37919 RepID=A0A1B1KHN3_RHOOP|nr:MurR/RpiR family transcriptional regulator [Rhodococcus opacus]ANS32133.1 RpiR family transcriptional regulator [Rhodococcus opacus]KXF55802.1 RpiR family transcriptional regulator [Rhodococcus sp. SC4]
MSETIQEWVTRCASGSPLGPATSRVVDILATQPSLASYASTADLAERAKVTDATVVRTARQLGFSGWPELRLELRSRYLATLSANQVLAEHRDGATNPVVDSIRRDIENLESLARALDHQAVHATAKAIHAAPRTLVIGSGSFAAPGLQLAHMAQTMGHDVQLDRHFGTHLVNSLNRLTPGDCLVTINLWWVAREVMEATTIAQEAGITTCVITDRRSSPLAEAATHLIVTPSEGVSFFPSLTPTMAIIHGLLAEIARLGGDETRTAFENTEAMWKRMRLFNGNG